MSKEKKETKKSPNSLTMALKEVENFIIQISANIEESSRRTNPEILFTLEDEGGLSLYDDEAIQYIKCLHFLIDAVSSDQISPKTIEKHYQKAILTTLDIKEHRKSQPFETRLDKAIQDLESALKANPYHFHFYYPVEGLAQEGLPLKFGNVNFCVLTAEKARMLTQGSGSPLARAEEQPRSNRISHEMIQKGLVGKVVGVVDVLATESEAAKTLALKLLRLTLDVFNFFSGFIPFSNGCFIYLPGDRSREYPFYFVTSNEGKQNYSVGYQLVGPLRPLSAKRLEDADQKINNGFKKASHLLIERNGDFQERLLSAIQWAGRASAEDRKEEAFLLYAIALESLVLPDNVNSELNYRLRIRVAYLLGKSGQSRKQLYEQVRKLYDIRSKIVHGSKYQVTDEDLSLMRRITKSCIIRVLTDTEFLNIKCNEDFIKWLDDSILNCLELDAEV